MRPQWWDVIRIEDILRRSFIPGAVGLKAAVHDPSLSKCIPESPRGEVGPFQPPQEEGETHTPGERVGVDPRGDGDDVLVALGGMVAVLLLPFQPCFRRQGCRHCCCGGCTHPENVPHWFLLTPKVGWLYNHTRASEIQR